MVLALGGCGGSGDAPASSGTESGSESSSESPSPSPSQSIVLPDPTPTVEPASGPRLEVEGLRVNAPAKWAQIYDTIFSDAAQGPSGGVLLTVVAHEQVSLKAAERFFWDSKKPPRGYERRGTLVMGGLTANYHTAPDGKYSTAHVVSLWDSGYIVKLQVSLDKVVPTERQQEILASVVASYERS